MKVILKLLKIILKIVLFLWEAFFALGFLVENTKENYAFCLCGIVLGLFIYFLLNALLNSLYSMKIKKEKIDHELIYKAEIIEEKENTKKEFKISDMYQFKKIPFEWKWVEELSGVPGKQWFMLNMNNQYIALHYIQEIINLINKNKPEIMAISGIDFCTEDIEFDYPEKMYPGCMPCTYILCHPYTNKGNISKHPITLHFETSEIKKK